MQEVTAYRAKNGKLFDTPEEARVHDIEVERYCLLIQMEGLLKRNVPLITHDDSYHRQERDGAEEAIKSLIKYREKWLDEMVRLTTMLKGLDGGEAAA